MVPTKARYGPTDDITVRIHLSAQWEGVDCLDVTITLFRLGHPVGDSVTQTVDADSSGILTVTVAESAGRRQHGGLICRCALRGKAQTAGPRGEVVYAAVAGQEGDEGVCRYAFVSNFQKGVDVEDVAEWLASMHVTHVQFYDWMYRHEELVPESNDYSDALGRPLHLPTVRAMVEACHERGIKAIAYGAVYGAGKTFLDEHPDWALRRGDGTPCTLVDWLYIMNPARGSPWRKHLVDQYASAVASLGFDGIHMDAYGRPKRAYDSGSTLVDLAAEFPSLIIEVWKRLERIGNRAPTLFFNAVNNWPTAALAQTPVAAPYVEVWPPHTTYRDLVEIVRENRRIHKKTPILAAYLSPFDPERTANPAAMTNANWALLYAAAVIHSAGATHLVLGEAASILYHPYYVTHRRLSIEGERLVRRYWDFATAYSDLFLDASVVDLTRDHAHGPDDEFSFAGAPTSAYPVAGRVWVSVLENEHCYVIMLVNLSELDNDEWNMPHRPPSRPAENIVVSASCPERITECFSHSPDQPVSGFAGNSAVGIGLPERLTVEQTHSHHGQTSIVTVPPTVLWRIVWMTKAAHPSARSPSPPHAPVSTLLP